MILMSPSASSHWTVVRGKGSIPPPRTYHSCSSYWCREKGDTGQFLVFSGGAVGTTPVKDRKVYKFDPGRHYQVTVVIMYMCMYVTVNLAYAIIESRDPLPPFAC